MVEDIGGSGSSVLAVRGRVVDDRGRTCRRGLTRRGAACAKEAQHQMTGVVGPRTRSPRLVMQSEESFKNDNTANR